MELSKLEIIILVLIERRQILSVIDMSKDLQIDKPIIYKCVKNLKNSKLIKDNNERPKQFFINEKQYKIWEKKQ